MTPQIPLLHRYDTQEDYDDALAEYHKRLEEYDEWADREIDRMKEEREQWPNLDGTLPTG